MYPSTFSHLNTNFELPTETIQPIQTAAPAEPKRRRRGARRSRRRLAFGLGRLAPGGSASP